MTARSLTANQDGIQQINRALTDRGWSREDLAKECECSRQPAVKFGSGNAVSKKLFVSFCNALELDWEEIAGQKPAAVPDETPNAGTDIDALVQAIRARVYDDIQSRCGTMRVLDMEQPIGLGDIYTSVNILEKLSRNQRPPRGEWLKHDPENFDRFLLGQVHQQRIPGLQAVEEHSQLMILGKPGAGKTTFMKRLAILCNQGEFQPQRVPVFVTLKDYAEDEEELKLQNYIQRQWNDCGMEAVDALSTVLGDGKALVLLDGLDEVQETDHDRVLQDIKNFAQRFRSCQCVITCRIAAREYTFELFSEVEVADFDQDQIAEFATKWFVTRNDPQKTDFFIKELNNEDNKPIRELAVTPILLTLLCLIFEETSEFPGNRSDFYREGTDWLLKRWDDRRGIKRDPIYKRLSLPRKKELLSQLAFETFEHGDYFFKQDIVEQHIMRYIRKLTGASDEEETLQLDSEAVLKSIEAQHGLLIERAKGIYSFSHLTFQEYLTAQHVISPKRALSQTLQNLADHVGEKRYREVFLLVTELLPDSDKFMLFMKKRIDQMMEADHALQRLLAWASRKSRVANGNHKDSSIRAFYIYLAFGLENSVSYDPDTTMTIANGMEFNGLSLNLIADLGFPIDWNRILDLGLSVDQDLFLLLDYILTRAISMILVFSFNGLCYFSSNINIYAEKILIFEAILNAINKISNFQRERCGDDEWLKICDQAEIFMSLVSDLSDPQDFFVFLRGKEGEAMVDRFRLVAQESFDVGHKWSFSKTERLKIQQYYDGNKLLVDCLNNTCCVTKATRQYIEDTLLLPLSEIEKYPVPDAIANL